MTTEAVTGFQTPEEAALDLELPLLGTLPSPSDERGPIAPRVSDDERTRREYHRAADRILLSPLSRSGSVGILGDVSSLHRARIAADLSAALSAEKTSILVDADLTGAHLSFDDRGRAQEGLVDVLRYGVRSPRVVAPTQAPGLNLLPVGSGTVDLASTYGSDATPSLFAELRRTGDLVIVNGPDLTELEAAAPFLSEVGSWILVHEFGSSAASKTRALKAGLGHAACVGVLAVVSERALAEKALRRPRPADAPAPTPTPAPPPPSTGWVEEEADPYAPFRPSDAEHPPPPPLPPRGSTAADDPWAEPEPVATEKTSVGGAFEPIRAVPPEPRPEPRRRGGYQPFGDESVIVEEEAPRPARRTSSKVLIGVLLGASVGVAALFWFGGGEDLPPATRSPAARPADRSPAGSKTVVRQPAPPAPATQSPTSQSPATESPTVEPRGAPSPASSEPSASSEPPAAVSTPAATSPFAKPEPPAPEPTAAAPKTAPPPATTPAVRAQPAKTATATAPGVPKPTPAGAWGVHVSSLLTEDRAQSEIDGLERAGWTAVSRHVLVEGKGLWFRIYVGPYATKEDARKVAGELKASGRSWAVAQKIPEEGTGREDR